MQGSDVKPRKSDLISKLPDAVLCHILTYLPTKSVVKTSLLSKRWKHLWTKVPALDFTEMTDIGNKGLCLKQLTHFRNFVNKVLLYNHVPFVERFHLDLVDCDLQYVSSWLVAATRRKIHELNISIGPQMIVHLPREFLLNEGLVVLKLKGPMIFSASTSFFLPKLETIHLQNLEFPDDEFMKKLSSSCPVLRELRIVNCGGIATTLHVESLTLESLEIQDTIAGREKPEQQRIVVKTPNLTCFCLSDYQSLYDIGDMNKLVEADISIYAALRRRPANVVADLGHHARMLLEKVSGIMKTLRLGPEAILPQRMLPTFRNLTSLQCEAELTCELLRCAPQLKCLIVQFNQKSLFEPRLAAKQLPCLESVEVCCFRGLGDEINTVAYFLNAASALKEMKINLEYTLVD